MLDIKNPTSPLGERWFRGRARSISLLLSNPFQFLSYNPLGRGFPLPISLPMDFDPTRLGSAPGPFFRFPRFFGFGSHFWVPLGTPPLPSWDDPKSLLAALCENSKDFWCQNEGNSGSQTGFPSGPGAISNLETVKTLKALLL